MARKILVQGSGAYWEMGAWMCAVRRISPDSGLSREGRKVIRLDSAWTMFLVPIAFRVSPRAKSHSALHFFVLLCPSSVRHEGDM